MSGLWLFEICVFWNYAVLLAENTGNREVWLEVFSRGADI